MTPRRGTLDQPGLRSLAITYVARYATSLGKLAAYLRRKLREQDWIGDSAPDIESLVEACVRNGFIDDSAFASARVTGLRAKGFGERRIHQALRQSGIADELARNFAATDSESALRDALKLAARKRIGPFSQGVADDRQRMRWAGQLARAGHDSDVVRKVLRMDLAEAERSSHLANDDG